MIDLQAKSVSDSQKIHNNTLGTGGFAVDLTITEFNNPGNTITIKGLYNDTGITIDFESGMPTTGAKIAVSFHGSDLTIWDGVQDLQRWKVEFENGSGQSMVVEISDVMPDRSFGDILTLCKIISGHR